MKNVYHSGAFQCCRIRQQRLSHHHLNPFIYFESMNIQRNTKKTTEIYHYLNVISAWPLFCLAIVFVCACMLWQRYNGGWFCASLSSVKQAKNNRQRAPTLFSNDYSHTGTRTCSSDSWNEKIEIVFETHWRERKRELCESRLCLCPF